MSRPSGHLDLKLIAAARAMLPESGLTALSVREVARRAGVNAGMFHYHFKTKKAFQRRVLQEVYEDFFATFREAADGPGGPRPRLRRVLVSVARFGRENRVLLTLMLRELMNAQPEVRDFARLNFPRHVAVVAGLLEECRGRGEIRDLPIQMLVMFAMSTMGLPNVFVTALERNGIDSMGGLPLAGFSELLLSDEMIEARADMVLAALRPGRLR